MADLNIHDKTISDENNETHVDSGQGGRVSPPPPPPLPPRLSRRDSMRRHMEFFEDYDDDDTYYDRRRPRYPFVYFLPFLPLDFPVFLG